MDRKGVKPREKAVSERIHLATQVTPLPTEVIPLATEVEEALTTKFLASLQIAGTQLFL